LRIATVFGVGPDSFFSDERNRRAVGVVRRAERVRCPTGRSQRMCSITLSAWTTGPRSAS
jgi:hypothetical protein